MGRSQSSVTFKLLFEAEDWVKNLVLFHHTYTGQGQCGVLKAPENPATGFVEFFPITETIDKRSRQVHKMGVRNRKYQNWCWRWEGSLKEEIVQKCCWIFIYNSKHTPRSPVCGMPLYTILYDQKVSEITESHQHKNSVMYCKNLMLLYFIIWKMKKEVLWKFGASGSKGDTSSFTHIFLLKIFYYILWKRYSKSSCHNRHKYFCS